MPRLFSIRHIGDIQRWKVQYASGCDGEEKERLGEALDGSKAKFANF